MIVPLQKVLIFIHIIIVIIFFQNQFYSRGVYKCPIKLLYQCPLLEGRHGVTLSHAIAAAYTHLLATMHGLDLGCSFTAPLVYKEAAVRRIHLRLGHSIRILASASTRPSVSKCSVRVCL